MKQDGEAEQIHIFDNPVWGQLFDAATGAWPTSPRDEDKGFVNTKWVNGPNQIGFSCRKPDWSTPTIETINLPSSGTDAFGPNSQAVALAGDQATHFFNTDLNGGLKYSRVTGFEPGQVQTALIRTMGCDNPAAALGQDNSIEFAFRESADNRLTYIPYGTIPARSPQAGLPEGYTLAAGVSVLTIQSFGNGTAVVFYERDGNVWAQPVNFFTGPVGEPTILLEDVAATYLHAGPAAEGQVPVAYYNPATASMGYVVFNSD